ncbi:MAG: hypothetical protein QMD92_08185 [bacterium]|nr:hypothetical protein [bacterium]
MIEEMCAWIAKNLGGDTPIHFSRFYPMYKLSNLHPTPVKKLEMARKIAFDKGLKYVYIGNVVGHIGENTFYPICKRIIIKRVGYKVLSNNIKNGRCKDCKTEIPEIWKI